MRSFKKFVESKKIVEDIFVPALYKGKWAVLDTVSQVYYDVKGGKDAAEKKCKELNAIHNESPVKLDPLEEAEYNAEWWDSKSDNFKKRYIERHPNSIYAQKANLSNKQKKDITKFVDKAYGKNSKPAKTVRDNLDDKPVVKKEQPKSDNEDDFSAHYKNGWPDHEFSDKLKDEIKVVDSKAWYKPSQGIKFNPSTYGDYGTNSKLKISDNLYNWLKDDINNYMKSHDKIDKVAKAFTFSHPKNRSGWETIDPYKFYKGLCNAKKVDGGYEVDVDTTTYDMYAD